MSIMNPLKKTSHQRQKENEKYFQNFNKYILQSDKIYSYTKKPLATWQNWCFGLFYHSKIEILHACSAFFCVRFSGEPFNKRKMLQSTLCK